MKCPICSSVDTQQVYKNPEIYNERDVILCKNCDLFFIDPLPTDDELRRLYETEWSWNYGMKEDSKLIIKVFQFVYEMHQKFIAQERARHLFGLQPELSARSESSARTEASARILEIGSGNGAFLREISKRYHRVEGIEPSLNEDYHKDRVFIKRETFDGDFSGEELYDAICTFMVLEHLADPVEMVNRLKKGIKKGGLLVFEIPFSPYKEFAVLDDFERSKVFHNVHLFHFSQRNLEYLAQRVDMELKEFEVIRKIEFIKGYNVFAVYPNSSQKGLAYKAGALFNLMILYMKGLLGLPIHEVIDEDATPFGDGFWIRFVLRG
jgi:SAM-dependent methyltransferase